MGRGLLNSSGIHMIDGWPAEIESALFEEY